jgi:hypothetical protein
MGVLDQMRAAARVTTDAFDDELQLLIDAAVADMRRVGVRDGLLDADPMPASVRMPVMLYVRAHFGYDNATERPQFEAAYRQCVTDLMNSDANEFLYPDEGEGGDGGE